MLRNAFARGALLRPAAPIWRAALLLPRAQNHFISTTSPTQRSNGIPRLRPRNIVKLGGKPDSGLFEFDEETHILSPPVDCGYISLQLGHWLIDIERPPIPTYRLSNTDGYEVVRKLGWGREASVWLARRHVKGETNPQPRFVAIKFLTAYHSAVTITKEPTRFEFKALNQYHKSNLEHAGKQHCALMQDAFPYFGSKHGPHLCMVFDPYSISLQQYINEMRERDPEMREWGIRCIRNVVRQVLQALSYVHETKLVHTDLKMDNLYIDPGRCDDEIETLLLTDPSHSYPPRVEPRLQPDPIITVKSQPLPVFGTRRPRKLRLRLGDFGGVRPVGEDGGHRDLAMPDMLRAPEVVLGCPWGTPVDIWSLGCMIYEFIFPGKPAFDTRFEHRDEYTQMHALLARIEEVLGPIPSSLLERALERDTYFTADGRLRFQLPSTTSSKLENQVTESRLKGSVSDAGLRDLARFIRRCLTVDPLERPSADELLKDSWL